MTVALFPNEVFSPVDSLAEKYQLEKIRTIGHPHPIELVGGQPGLP